MSEMAETKASFVTTLTSILSNMGKTLVGTLMKTVSFKGRASKGEFWLYILFMVLVAILSALLLMLTEGSVLGNILAGAIAIVFLALFVCYISVSVRRLHDLGFSGFWLWYLNPAGLPIVFMVYLLDLDTACNKVVEKILKIGSIFGWILTWLFWPIGAPCALALLFLYDGKKEENEFGPAPSCCAK